MCCFPFESQNSWFCPQARFWQQCPSQRVQPSLLTLLKAGTGLLNSEILNAHKYRLRLTFLWAHLSWKRLSGIKHGCLFNRALSQKRSLFSALTPKTPLAVLDLTANDKLYTGTRHLCPYHHLLTVVIVADNVVIIIGILSTAGLEM